MAQYPHKFGKYILLDRVNVGGMAEVFRAKPVTPSAGDSPIIAIKRILPSLVEDEEFIKMFIDEARIAVQLDHPNIVRIYELGKHASHYYIAMEYLPSRDLRVVLDRMRSKDELMSISQAAHIAARVCGGLDHAHKKKNAKGESLAIIHRDVSPQNVLLTFNGDVKLIDFGIAKAANRASKTQAGVLKGKFGYMSPEQVRGLPIDHRSDIFAVGVLLYEMLTGERLFIGESDYSTLERVRNAEVIPPTTFNKKISPELEQVVLRALAREPEARYQWAEELGDALSQFVTESTPEALKSNVHVFMQRHYPEEMRMEAEHEAKHSGIQNAPDEPTNVAPLLKHTDDESYGDFEDAKTYVLEASEAGLELHGDKDNAAKGVTAEVPAASEPELYDDSKTMVSMNPYTGEDPLIRMPDHTEMHDLEEPQATELPAKSASLAEGQTQLPMENLSTNIQEAESSVMDPVQAAMQDDLNLALPVAAPLQASAANPVVPPSPLTENTPETLANDRAGLQSSRSPQAVSKGPTWVLPALIASSLLSFLILLAAIGLYWSKTQDRPSTVLLESTTEVPPGTRVFLDGQGIKEGLPARFDVGVGPHEIKVVSNSSNLIIPIEAEEGRLQVFSLALGPILKSKSVGTDKAPKDGQELDSTKDDPGQEKDEWSVTIATSSDKKDVAANVYYEGKKIGSTPFVFRTRDLKATLTLKGEGLEDKEISLSKDDESSTPKNFTMTIAKGPSGDPTDTQTPGNDTTGEPKTEATTKTSGSKTSGSKTSGSKTTGTQASGTKTTGTKTTGTKTTGTKSDTKTKSSRTVRVAIGTRPPAKVFLNKRNTHKSTPLLGKNALKMKVGVNYLLFIDDKGKEHRYQITVPPGATSGKAMILLDTHKTTLVKSVKVKRL